MKKVLNFILGLWKFIPVEDSVLPGTIGGVEHRINPVTRKKRGREYVDISFKGTVETPNRIDIVYGFEVLFFVNEKQVHSSWEESNHTRYARNNGKQDFIENKHLHLKGFSSPLVFDVRIRPWNQEGTFMPGLKLLGGLFEVK